MNSRMLILLWIAMGAAACKNSTGPQTNARPTSSFLSFTSETGDYIGGVESHRYTLLDGPWSARFDTLNFRTGHVRIDVNTASADWGLDLSGPRGQPLIVGRYVDASRWPFNQAKSGLSFTGGTRGCNEVSGRFIIFELVLGPEGTVTFLHAAFEQHCDNSIAALKGEIAVVGNPLR